MAITAAMYCDRFGRRKLFLWSTAGMLASYMCASATSPLLLTGCNRTCTFTLNWLYLNLRYCIGRFSAWATCGIVYGLNNSNKAAGSTILGLVFCFYGAYDWDAIFSLSSTSKS